MIEELNIHNIDKEVLLQSDLGAKNPLYVLHKDNKIYYSKNISLLIENKKLEVSSEGVSFLLKNGVIPPPNSIYKNLYILSIGDKLLVSKEGAGIKLNFSKYFDFIHENKKNKNDFSLNDALKKLANATLKDIDSNKDSYLFHSAGKDSNTLLLALDSIGYKDIKLVSYKSENSTDESYISKKIANKLGYEHHILTQPNNIFSDHLNSINNYFKNIPFPVMDNATLAYPLYSTQLDFFQSNIIDGMGNDVFIGHIPSINEYKFATYLSKLSFLKPLTNQLNSENYFNIVGLDKIEWVGLMGFMNKDSSNIYNNFISPDNYWKSLQKESKELNYLDLRAKIRGGIIDQEIFMRKVRNFADVYSSNIVFPWADQEVVEYFYNLDKKYLFDDNSLKNKLILRQIIKEKLNLDSDKIGKLGYSFDYWKILENMRENVKQNVIECKLWNRNEIERLYNRLYIRASKKDRFANRAKSLIQRLYLLSVWYNLNKYIKR